MPEPVSPALAPASTVSRWRYLLPAACVVAVCAHASNAQTISFTDRSADISGFTHSGLPNVVDDAVAGVAVFDFNNDGHLDLFFANGEGGPDGLLENQGDATFVNVGPANGFANAFGSSGVAAGDLDNDGDEDLIIVGETGAFAGTPSSTTVRVMRNELIETGASGFTDVTAASGISIPSVAGATMAVVLGDIDNDGLLDVFISAPSSLSDPLTLLPNHLYANDGGLSFSDIGAGSNVDYAGASCVATFTHYDNDGLIDLFVGDCNLSEERPTFPFFTPLPGPLRLYTNNGDRTFTRRTDVGLPDPTVDDDGQGFWMALSPADINNDLRMDLFATNFGTATEQPHQMLFQRPGGSFVNIAQLSDIANQAPAFGWGSTAQDFNHDGLLDVFLAGNFPIGGDILDNPGYVMTNQGAGVFAIAPLPGAPLVDRYSSGVAAGDFNNDGAVDVVVSNSGYLTIFDFPPVSTTDQPLLLINDNNDNNNWLTVKLQGTQSNRSGIGAVIDVRVGASLRMRRTVSGGGGFLSRDSTWQTFGLGPSPRARTVTVRWPSGIVDRQILVAGNQAITIVEGSTPQKQD